MFRGTLALALVVAALSLLVSGCGGGSDEAKVESTVNTFFDGFVNHDGEQACSVLTGSAQRTLLADSSLDCATALKLASTKLGNDEIASLKNELDNAKPAVTVNGSTATVHYDFVTSPFGGNIGEFDLVKVEGKWYINGTKD